MAYSLITQMLSVLQQSPNRQLGYVSLECKKLDRSVDSLPAAISLLDELINMGPGLVFCIIDGIQDLAYRLRGDPNLQRLLAVLRKPPQEKQGQSEQVLKTLFTTDCNTSVLAHLGPGERLDLSDLHGQNEAEFGPGYTAMGFLALQHKGIDITDR